jgi:hypothetical protein
MGILDYNLMTLLVPKPTIKKDKYCPVCNCGNIESHRIRICSDCQDELMPEGNEQDNEEPTINRSIGDYSGMYHTMY